MRHTPSYLLTDVAEIKDLIRLNSWATLVAHTRVGLVASHYPVMLVEDTAADDIVITAHVGRPDEKNLELGSGELLVIIQGPHGYISPSWYPEGDNIPTWNHITAHLYGQPEILSVDENYAELERLVDYFESAMPQPRSLSFDETTAQRVAKGTVGFRMHVDRFDARAKFSQNRPAEVAGNIITQLESDGPYADAALAKTMRHFLGR